MYIFIGRFGGLWIIEIDETEKLREKGIAEVTRIACAMIFVNANFLPASRRNGSAKEMPAVHLFAYAT